MDKTQPMKIERELTGEPIFVGQYVLHPQARMSGWQWNAPMPAGQAGGAFAQIAPTAVVVNHADGVEQRLALTNSLAEALRGMAIAAAGMAGVSLLIMLVAQLFTKRRAMPGVAQPSRR